MLLLGGAATIEALTGMDYRLASFLIPWGVTIYTAAGGLKATFLASYIHTGIIFGVVITMVFVVYIKVYSSNQIYQFLEQTTTYTVDDCKYIFQNGTDTFYEAGKYACGPVRGNYDGTYLTMLSSDGLMFGIINIVGNFGTVFVDQSYWQSAIAARPSSAAKGYLLGGLCWFAIPFSLASSLGLSSTALQLPLTAAEAGAGLVPPAVAVHLMGDSGAVLILVMLFMAIVSTGSSESIAVSSLVAYDIYREYFNREATGADILRVSRIVIVVFNLFVGCFSIALYEMGLNLGWVYLFMGVMIGSAVAPLWFMMTWTKASGTGAVLAAWGGLILGLVSWIIAAQVQSGVITVNSLGTNEVMLSGNLVSIFSSAFIHYFWSVFIDKNEYDFAELDPKILLVEDDMSGLGPEQQDPVELQKAHIWITRRGYVLTFVLLFVWPILSIPAGQFSEGYFAFWILIAIAWSFGAAIIIVALPIMESTDDISRVAGGAWRYMLGKPAPATSGEEVAEKEIDEVEEPASKAAVPSEDIEVNS